MEGARLKGDVVVIGAGLVGALIAYALADSGRRVAVLEAGSAGQAVTARITGLVTPQLTAAGLPGTLRGVDEMTNLALRLGVAPRSCRVLHLATRRTDLDTLHEFHQSFSGDRPKLFWETQPGGLPTGYTAGLVAHYSVLVDVMTLVARVLQHPNITVRENAEVQSLEWRSGRVAVLANGYTVQSPALVLATNAFVGLLSPYLVDAVRLARGYTWTSKPINEGAELQEHLQKVLPTPFMIDDGQMLVVQTPDLRLHVNAWRLVDGANTDPADDVGRFLKEYLPELQSQGQTQGSCVTTVTSDGAPLVGRLTGEGAVYYAVGAGVYGPAWAPVIAGRVVQMIDETTS